MIDARETLQEIRDTLQIGPDGQAPVSLFGPAPNESEYFPQTCRNIGTRRLSNRYRHMAAAIGRQVNNKAGSNLIDLNATIGKGLWVGDEIPHVVPYLRRIGTVWERGAKQDLVGADPYQDAGRFGIYCAAEYLVCSALLRWGKGMRTYDPAIYVSAYDLGVYRTAVPDMSSAYFRQVIQATKATKPIILPLLNYITVNKVPPEAFNADLKNTFFEQVWPKATS